MNTVERRIIEAHMVIALNQYVKARDGETIYRDQTAVRAAIVHALDDLMVELAIPTRELRDFNGLPVNLSDIDRAASDAQEAFRGGTR